MAKKTATLVNGKQLALAPIEADLEDLDRYVKTCKRVLTKHVTMDACS